MSIKAEVVMKNVIVMLPMVLASLNVFATKLEHIAMDKMNFDQQSLVKNYKDWVVTKIPSKNINSVANYRLDLTVSKMDRKKFNLYNYRFNVDPSTTTFYPDKTYKIENFLPSFLISQSKVNSKQRLPEASTLLNTAHWIEWRSGNQSTYIKDSLRLVGKDVSPQVFETILEEYVQEVNLNVKKTGDFVVVYGTDDIDQIQMPVASYIYIGNGVVLESKKFKNQYAYNFAYLKDIQAHFKNRMVDYRLRSFKIKTNKPLYLSEFLKDSKGSPDLNPEKQVSNGLGEIL